MREGEREREEPEEKRERRKRARREKRERERREYHHRGVSYTDGTLVHAKGVTRQGV